MAYPETVQFLMAHCKGTLSCPEHKLTLRSENLLPFSQQTNLAK